MLTTNYNYQETLAASVKVNWRIEDIIGVDKRLDVGMIAAQGRHHGPAAIIRISRRSSMPSEIGRASCRERV